MLNINNACCFIAFDFPDEKTTQLLGVANPMEYYTSNRISLDILFFTICRKLLEAPIDLLSLFFNKVIRFFLLFFSTKVETCNKVLYLPLRPYHLVLTLVQ